MSGGFPSVPGESSWTAFQRLNSPYVERVSGKDSTSGLVPLIYSTEGPEGPEISPIETLNPTVIWPFLSRHSVLKVYLHQIPLAVYNTSMPQASPSEFLF